MRSRKKARLSSCHFEQAALLGMVRVSFADRSAVSLAKSLSSQFSNAASGVVPSASGLRTVRSSCAFSEAARARRKESAARFM